MTSLKDFKTASERRSFIEKETGKDLSAVSSNIESSENVHCENLIGAAQIPLGVAGPLKLSGEKATGEYFIPLATTEGALVASVSRGSKAISENGGAFVSAFKLGTTRGPVFYTGSLEKSNELRNWIKSHEEEIKKTAEFTSNHLLYKKVSIKSIGDYTYLRLIYDTHDAMGMNMVTIATQAVCDLITEQTGIQCLSVAGNFDVDKKASFMNLIEGRGYEVWGEATLKKEIVESVLKTTPEKFFDVWLAKCMLGSASSGSLGFNSHFANIIAALFLATGQDAAHVVEGSLGITTAKVEKSGDLRVGVYLPAVMVGTIGGGTNLPTQSTALELLSVKGTDHSHEFAEIVAGAVLAGEISLLASLSEGTLARAHKELGR